MNNKGKTMNKNMRLIGKGMFTRCYRKGNSKKVLLKSNCPIKECMSLGWFPNSTLFPKVTRIDRNMYEMKYYPKVRSLRKALTDEQYSIYLELREIGYYHNTSYETLKKAFEGISNKRVRNALLDAQDACENYGHVGFEISPRNVTVSPSGKLILMDVFLNIPKMRMVRERGTYGTAKD